MDCYSCGESVSSFTVNKILCTLCKNTYHIQCTDLSKNVFKAMKTGDKKSWLCRGCIHLFPFNHNIEQSEFLKLVTNNDTRFISCFSDLIFNPFELYQQDENTLRYDDYDPDVHYYNNSQINNNICNSKYYNIEEFNLNVANTKTATQFSIYHCNIRSATKNANNLSNMMQSLNQQFDIVALTETWLNKNNSEIVGFHNYNHVCKYRENRIGGGVSILLKHTIQYHELSEFSLLNETIECVFVEIEMLKKNVIIGCVYRPPNSNLSQFNDELSCMLDKLTKSGRHVYLVGDYNIDLLKADSHPSTVEFINTMFSSSFIPLINRPTRVTDSTASIIDNIFTNHHDVNHSWTGIIPTDVSDHFSIFHIIYDKYLPNLDNITKYKRVINDDTIHRCVTMMHNINWQELLSSNESNTAYELFTQKFNEVINYTMPIKKIKLDSRVYNKPWITTGLLTSIVNKNKMYKQIKITGDIALEEKYKKMKNQLGKLLKLAEKNYFKSTLNKNKGNLKKLWQTLNHIISKKKNVHNKITFKYQDKLIDNDIDIANNFNNYFLNVAKDICKKIPEQKRDPLFYMKNNIENSMFWDPTNENEISEIISKMKNSSCGHDGIDSKILKAVKHEILTPLMHICNLSFIQGTIPDNLKIAKVIPILKKGDCSLFSNYRPISILPAISKIIEKLAYKRIIHFLDQNNILNNNQFGFRKNRSTDMAIQTLVDKFHETIEKDEIMVGIFIDLSRAFDTIAHGILLRKLHFYGIRGASLKWIEDYLTNRKQYVEYNNSKSNLGKISIGVPQGSILGPLLFLIYVNDISCISEKISCILFADDTNIFTTGKTLSDISVKINNELKFVNEWLHCNKLSLNISKTHYMIMSSPGKRFKPDECVINMDGHIIDHVKETKFLGIIIDDKFTWKNHIDYICNKTAKGMGILLRARQMVYGETLHVLYNTLIKPHFTYCITIWGNTYKTYLNRLHIAQKKIVRIITFSEFCAHTAPLFQKLHIMNIYDLHNYFVGLFVFKSLNGLFPPSFCNMFVRNINARTSMNLRSLYRRKKISLISIRSTGPKIWNAFPQNIKCSGSIFIFKKYLKKYLSNNNE